MKNSFFFKSTFALLAAIFIWTNSTIAQSDSTTYHFGNLTIVISENDDDIEENTHKLQDAKLELELENAMLQDSILTLLKLTETETGEELTKTETLLTNAKADLAAIEADISTIDKKIDSMADEKHSGSRKNSCGDLDDDDFCWDWDDFDWDWDDLPWTRKDKFRGHWAGFELGLNMLMSKDFETELPDDGKYLELKTSSWAFALNFIEINIPVFKSYAGFTTGMGLEWNNYNFKQNITLHEDADGNIAGLESQDIDFTTNKLHTTYLTVPLLFEFQIPAGKRGRRFYLGGGIVGGVRLWSKVKQEYERDGYSHETVTRGDYKLAQWRYGLTARVGYGALRFFANYSLVPLFEEDKGPEVFPFSVGITLINF